MRNYFYNSNRKKFDLKHVAKEIAEYANKDKESKYKIIIGTDSKLVDKQYADFVTAIVVHKIGNGGIYFWNRKFGEKVFNLRDRIIKEVLFSISTSSDFMNEIKKYEILDFEFEIHIDVGEIGKTKTLISEVAGIVRSNNFVYKTKPESYAASNVADKYV